MLVPEARQASMHCSDCNGAAARDSSSTKAAPYAMTHASKPSVLASCSTADHVCAGCSVTRCNLARRETSPTKSKARNAAYKVPKPTNCQCAHARGNAAERSPLLGLAVVQLTGMHKCSLQDYCQARQSLTCCA
jgi:hypothetical protein